MAADLPPFPGEDEMGHKGSCKGAVCRGWCFSPATGQPHAVSCACCCLPPKCQMCYATYLRLGKEKSEALWQERMNSAVRAAAAIAASEAEPLPPNTHLQELLPPLAAAKATLKELKPPPAKPAFDKANVDSFLNKHFHDTGPYPQADRLQRRILYEEVLKQKIPGYKAPPADILTDEGMERAMRWALNNQGRSPDQKTVQSWTDAKAASSVSPAQGSTAVQSLNPPSSPTSMPAMPDIPPPPPRRSLPTQQEAFQAAQAAQPAAPPPPPPARQLAEDAVAPPRRHDPTSWNWLANPAQTNLGSSAEATPTAELAAAPPQEAPQSDFGITVLAVDKALDDLDELNLTAAASRDMEAETASQQEAEIHEHLAAWEKELEERDEQMCERHEDEKEFYERCSTAEELQKWQAVAIELGEYEQAAEAQRVWNLRQQQGLQFVGLQQPDWPSWESTATARHWPAGQAVPQTPARRADSAETLKFNSPEPQHFQLSKKRRVDAAASSDSLGSDSDSSSAVPLEQKGSLEAELDALWPDVEPLRVFLATRFCPAVPGVASNLPEKPDHLQRRQASHVPMLWIADCQGDGLPKDYADFQARGEDHWSFEEQNAFSVAMDAFLFEGDIYICNDTMVTLPSPQGYEWRKIPPMRLAHLKARNSVGVLDHLGRHPTHRLEVS